MNLGKTVFSQLMSLLPDYEFNKCVDRYIGDYRIKELTCKEHFLVMSFARDELNELFSGIIVNEAVHVIRIFS